MSNFETQVIARLTAIEGDVASLGRAMRGAPEEGNVGLHTAVRETRATADKRHTETDARLDAIEAASLRVRAWAAGAAAAGGAVGATLAVLLDMRRLWDA